jgi:prefoldin alpha subunit
MGKKTARIEGKKEESKQDSQENYIKAQMLEQQLKQLQKYLENFEEQVAGIRALIDSLNEFAALNKGEKILAPLTNGIFIRAKLEDPTELLINVGNNVVVAKSIPEAIKLLEGQESELQQYRMETVSQLEELMKQIESMQS